ncbi:MAG: hypothetical protein OXT09_14285, partial [Myxococcales bacterium]|nr:hypothetical protein [Myxococcales bacterium]
MSEPLSIGRWRPGRSACRALWAACSLVLLTAACSDAAGEGQDTVDLTAGSAPAPIASTAGPEAMASGGVDTGTDPASPDAGEDTGGAAGKPAEGD